MSLFCPSQPHDPITESAAIAWKLIEVLDDRQKRSTQELNDDLMRLLVGSRQDKNLPEAFQIFNCIDRMEKKVPGARSHYDSLSEIAHPNWKGVFGLYSKTDETNFITYFGRGLRGAEDTRNMLANVMLGSIGLFEHAYNRISDAMPAFITELDKIWPDGIEDTKGETPSDWPLWIGNR